MTASERIFLSYWVFLSWPGIMSSFHHLPTGNRPQCLDLTCYFGFTLNFYHFTGQVMCFDKHKKDEKTVGEEVKWKRASGYYVLVAPATKAKSQVWKSLDHVYNENNEPDGSGKCTRCDVYK